MGENEVCMEHSGCKKAISQLEKDRDEDRETMKTDIFPRLRSLEKSVWQAAALSAGIMLVAQTAILHYWK
ncbi:MAG: hypothetical protein AB9917_02245 [Negativicutes bacterium]